MDFSSTYITSTVTQAQSELGKRKEKEALDAITDTKGMTDQRAREVAEDFEAVFLNTVVEAMFANVKTDDLFGGGKGEGIYRSMLNDQYAKAIAKSGGIGIADQVYRQILELQSQQTQAQQTQAQQTQAQQKPGQSAPLPE